MKETDAVKILVRLPADVKKWLEGQAAYNLSSQSSEVVRALRSRMESEQRA